MQCIVSNTQYAIHSVQYTVCNTQCAIHSEQLLQLSLTPCQVVQVSAHFTFDLNLQSSSTSGSCDIFSPECQTYLRFCLRGMRSDRSRNIGDCPLGNYGRIDEGSLPSTPSISSDNPWPVSLLCSLSNWQLALVYS